MPIKYGKSGGKRYVRWGHQKKHFYSSARGRKIARRAAGRDARRVYAATGGHPK